MSSILACVGVLVGWLLPAGSAPTPAPLWPAVQVGPQQPKPAPATPPASKPAPTPNESRGNSGIGNVQFESGTGWPVLAEDPAPPPVRAGSPAGSQPAARPAGETRAPAAAPGPAAWTDNPAPSPGAARQAAPALASGMQLGSPLLDVYQAVQSPGAFKALAGRVVWWRLITYGPQGEQIGVRELTHTVDCAFAERDRIEFQDGRVIGRVGALVFAERSGMPLPTQTEAAQHELMLFGLQVRMPWAFADANAYAVTGREVVEQGGDRLVRIVVERRPPPELDVVGPELEPKPRDRFELWLDPAAGNRPREFVHRFASSKQTRRVLLEDWRQVDGVEIPHRRVYVDDSLRPTTVLEILRIETQRVSERDFRLR
jgi:hypothetical protein